MNVSLSSLQDSAPSDQTIALVATTDVGISLISVSPHIRGREEGSEMGHIIHAEHHMG